VERHTHYLELRLAQCTPRPELHRHQIPVLRELIALAGSGISPAEYNRRAGSLFGLARAELLDRYDNVADIHAALDDERMLRVAQTSRSVADATNFAELSAQMTRTMADAAGLQLAATTAVDSLAPLVVSLLHWATEGEPRTQAALAETIKGLWRAIQHSDPGCSWQRICTAAPYRNRLPFGDDGLQLIGSWLHKAVGTQLADVPSPPPYDPAPLPVVETPDDPPLPSVADVARGYHVAYDYAKQLGTSSVLPIYERIFAIETEATCANDFMCKLTSEDLVCELSRAQFYDLATDALNHCAKLSQPLVELHYTSLVSALQRSTSTTEIDYEVTRHEACFAVESAWHQIFIAYAFRTITAAMGYELNPSESQRATVRNSYAVTRRLFGDWDELFAIGRVWEFFSVVFFDFGQELVDPPDLDGSHRGEVGLGILSAFRHHALQHVIEFVSGRTDASTEELDAEVERLVNSRRFATPEQMRDHTTSLFKAALDGKKYPKSPPGAAKPGVILWGQSVLFEALEGVLSSPPRPC